LLPVPRLQRSVGNGKHIDEKAIHEPAEFVRTAAKGAQLSLGDWIVGRIQELGREFRKRRKTSGADFLTPEHRQGRRPALSGMREARHERTFDLRSEMSAAATRGERPGEACRCWDRTTDTVRETRQMGRSARPDHGAIWDGKIGKREEGDGLEVEEKGFEEEDGSEVC